MKGFLEERQPAKESPDATPRVRDLIQLRKWSGPTTTSTNQPINQLTNGGVARRTFWNTTTQTTLTVHRPVDARERQRGQRGSINGGHAGSCPRWTVTNGRPVRASQEERSRSSPLWWCALSLHCLNPRESTPWHPTPLAGKGDVTESMPRTSTWWVPLQALPACGGEL